MKYIIAIITMLSCQWALAGDASSYKSLGFSKTGKYYAFIQEGEYDGLGAFWMEMGIIDVEANQYLGREHIGGEDENGNITEPSDRPWMLKELKKRLHFNAFGFTEQPRQETKVFRPNYDLSTYSDTIFTLEYWAQGGASASVQRFNLLLDEIKAPVTSTNQWCDEWYGNNMMELRLDVTDSYSGPGFKKDLQIDTLQPEVRACSFDYSVRYVFVHDNSMAVGISFRQPGFEGPNERFMVVTSKIFNN